jgi:phage head maturation protease
MDQLVVRMPFAKIDVEQRTVSGFATLDNVDTQGDKVTAEASIKAFSNFRGNIRELHDKIAAGRLVSFAVQKFFDAATGNYYDGIFVKAYISKGAPLTWEKVVDGTLNGFSIGGEITDFEHKVDEDGNVVRVIKGYVLDELSLVDSPANPLANILAIQKSVDYFEGVTQTVEGSTEMTKIEKSEGGSVASDGAVAADTVAVEEAAVEAVEVAEVEAEAPVVEADPVAEVEDDPKAELADETSSESVESDAPVSEADDSQVAELTAAIREVNTILAESRVATQEAFALIVAELKDLRATTTTTTTAINTVGQALEGELATVKSKVDGVVKRVEAVEADTAIQKSGDLGEVEQEQDTVIRKSNIWNGVFLDSANL